MTDVLGSKSASPSYEGHFAEFITIPVTPDRAGMLYPPRFAVRLLETPSFAGSMEH